MHARTRGRVLYGLHSARYSLSPVAAAARAAATVATAATSTATTQRGHSSCCKYKMKVSHVHTHKRFRITCALHIAVCVMREMRNGFCRIVCVCVADCNLLVVDTVPSSRCWSNDRGLHAGLSRAKRNSIGNRDSDT